MCICVFAHRGMICEHVCVQTTADPTLHGLGAREDYEAFADLLMVKTTFLIFFRYCGNLYWN